MPKTPARRLLALAVIAITFAVVSWASGVAIAVAVSVPVAIAIAVEERSGYSSCHRFWRRLSS